jgi:tRNA modification GTPase
MLQELASQDKICAITTASGSGAIAVIRVTGDACFKDVDKVFEGKESIAKAKHKSILYGNMVDGKVVIDDVIISIFHNPHSYTGEDVVEISCHGSIFIQKRIIQLLFEQGIRMAKAGEFTLRAYMNGKMDLAQSEAVADIISSDTRKSHEVAMQQMRGGYSEVIRGLRKELIHFTSLIELELDFSEEDVEFADRKQLDALLHRVKTTVVNLIDSFALGNVLKNGVNVVIAGKPNVGKSSLLNALLKEDKAIVSAIPGTTRDVIEDSIVLDGIRFRFSDTAGIREAQDEIEDIGIRRAYDKISEAQIVLFVSEAKDIEGIENELTELREQYADISIIGVLNKIDLLDDSSYKKLPKKHLCISAKEGKGIDEIVKYLIDFVEKKEIESDVIVSNERHLQALQQAKISLMGVEDGLKKNIATDLLSIDLKHALHHLGSITGEISVDNILENIFSSFCIGK